MYEPQIMDRVLWKKQRCIVTDAGRIYLRGKVRISPLGNGDAPAKYFMVEPKDIVLLCNPCRVMYVRIGVNTK